jgi:hypothetical protein
VDEPEPTYNVDNSGILAKEALTYSLVIYNNTENVTAKQKDIVIVQKNCWQAHNIYDIINIRSY